MHEWRLIKKTGANVTAHDLQFMQLAIEQMLKSAREVTPKVGAALVLNDTVIGQGHRRGDLHAERMAVEEATSAGHSLKGSILYTTLEPCIRGESKREACAELLVRHGVAAVVIGRYDDNPRVNRKGWRMLRDAGVVLRDFPVDLRARIDEINALFRSHFQVGYGRSGGAKFDYMLNDGVFEFRYSREDTRSIITRWAMIAPLAVQVRAESPAQGAVARYASTFDEIDDPTALVPGTSWLRVEVGQIAVFVQHDWCVLNKVLAVENGNAGARWNEIVRLPLSISIGRLGT